MIQEIEKLKEIKIYDNNEENFVFYKSEDGIYHSFKKHGSKESEVEENFLSLNELYTKENVLCSNCAKSVIHLKGEKSDPVPAASFWKMLEILQDCYEDIKFEENPEKVLQEMFSSYQKDKTYFDFKDTYYKVILPYGFYLQRLQEVSSKLSKITVSQSNALYEKFINAFYAYEKEQSERFYKLCKSEAFKWVLKKNAAEEILERTFSPMKQRNDFMLSLTKKSFDSKNFTETLIETPKFVLYLHTADLYLRDRTNTVSNLAAITYNFTFMEISVIPYVLYEEFNPPQTLNRDPRPADNIIILTEEPSLEIIETVRSLSATCSSLKEAYEVAVHLSK